MGHLGDQNKQAGMMHIVGSVYDAPSTTQKNVLGTTVQIGRRHFRYVSSKVSFAAGEVVGVPAASGIKANLCAAAAIGDVAVTITLGSVTLNQYQGGYLFTTDDAGQGYAFRIKSNTATSGGTFTVTLYDPLVVALTSASDVSLEPSLDYLVQQCTAALMPLGVSCGAWTGGGSTEQYGWIQTWGPGVALVTTATTIAAGLEVASGASGGIVIKSATIAKLGVALEEAEDAAGYQPIFIMVEQAGG